MSGFFTRKTTFYLKKHDRNHTTKGNINFPSLKQNFKNLRHALQLMQLDSHCSKISSKLHYNAKLKLQEETQTWNNTSHTYTCFLTVISELFLHVLLIAREVHTRYVNFCLRHEAGICNNNITQDKKRKQETTSLTWSNE